MLTGAVSSRQYGRKWVAKPIPIVLTTFILSSAIASVIFGAALGSVASTISTQSRGAIVVAGGGLLIAFGLSGRYPELNRETSKSWVHEGWLDWALKTGTELGVGATTRLGSPLWFSVPIAAFATGDPLLGGVIYATYGVARTTMSVLFGLKGVNWDKVLRFGRVSQMFGRLIAITIASIMVAIGI